MYGYIAVTKLTTAATCLSDVVHDVTFLQDVIKASL